LDLIAQRESLSVEASAELAAVGRAVVFGLAMRSTS